MGRVWHELQRSRTRVSAESFQQKRKRRTFVLASTEPHSCECGEDAGFALVAAEAAASTEPHSCECGERAPFLTIPLPEDRFNGAALV